MAGTTAGITTSVVQTEQGSDEVHASVIFVKATVPVSNNFAESAQAEYPPSNYM